MNTSRIYEPPRISVVVPVYGCVDCLDQLCLRVSKAVGLVTSSFKIILIDDRSPDDSWAAIQRLREVYTQVRGVRLSRNFGQHIAITTGLEAARVDYVVVMDCDLQDPPERIPEMYAKLRDGAHEMVLARRTKRSHSAMRVYGAKLYFKLLSMLAEEKIDGTYGTFSILSRKVVNAVLQFSERERHYLFMLRWLGFSTATIDYAHEERAAGRSSYSLARLSTLWTACSSRLQSCSVGSSLAVSPWRSRAARQRHSWFTSISPWASCLDGQA